MPEIPGIEGLPRSQWCIRRRMVAGVLLYCGGLLAFLAWRGNDGVLDQTLVISLVGTATSTIGAYLFGRTYDDQRYTAIVADLQKAKT